MQEIYIWLALLLPHMLPSIMERFLSAIYIYIYIYIVGGVRPRMEWKLWAQLKGGKRATYVSTLAQPID